MKDKKKLLFLSGIGIVILASVLFVTYLIINANSYRKIAIVFIIVWAIIASIIIIINFSQGKLLKPINVYIFSLTLFIFLPLFFDDGSKIFFKFYPHEYKNEGNLIKAMLLIIFSVGVFLLGTKIADRTFKLKNKNKKINSLINRVKPLMIINTVLLFIVLIVDFKISKDSFGSMWGRLTTNYTNQTQLPITRLLIYIYPMIIVNYYYIIQSFKLRMRSKVFIYLIMAFIIVYNLMSGNRALVLSAILGIIALHYKMYGITLKKVIIFVVIAALTYSAFVFSQEFRMNKNSYGKVAKTESSMKWQYDTLDVALLVVNHYPKYEDYSHGNSIMALVTNIIPRKYYPNKPLPFGKQLGSLVNPQDPNTISSYAAVTPIEIYSNFGVIGMNIFVFIFAYILQCVYILLGRAKKVDIDCLVYINIIIGLYMVFRGDFTTKTISMLIPIIAFYMAKMVMYLLLKKEGKKYV